MNFFNESSCARSSAVRSLRREGPDGRLHQPIKSGATLADYDSDAEYDGEEFYDVEDAPPTVRFKVAKIRRSWSKLKREDRLGFGSKIIGNYQKTPGPITGAAARATALQATYTPARAAQDLVEDLEGQLKTARADCVAKVDLFMGDLDADASAVEGITKGDPVPMLAIGYEMMGEHRPAGELAQGTNFALATGDEDGELDGNWDRADGARNYEPQSATNPADATTHKSYPAVTKSKFTFTGLGSGIRTHGRVNVNFDFV